MAEYTSRYCHACGKALPESEIFFCPFCGVKVGIETSSQEADLRPNVSAVLRRAEMALEERQFDRVHAFCETALNEDAECAEAYLYHLLADLRITDRAHLADARVLFDKNDHYKKAYRYGDQALREELLGALYAIDARRAEEARKRKYDLACSLLAGAKDIPTCRRAEAMLVSLGEEYLDAAQVAEACRARVRALYAEWEELKERKKIQAKERRAKQKRAAIISLAALVLALILTAVYLFVFRTAVPNGMREDALSMMAEGDYDGALSLLSEAREKAVFDSTKDKIDEAVAKVEAEKQAAALRAEEARQEAERLAEEERQRAAALNAAAREATMLFAGGNITKAMRLLHEKDIPVLVTFDAPNATVYNGKTEIEKKTLFTKAVPFKTQVTARRDAYRFEEWIPMLYTYDASTEQFNVTLRALFTEYAYSIVYDLRGGTAENPDGYSVSTPDFTLQIPERRGYTFLGWTGTDLEEMTYRVTIKTGSTGSRSYTANWQVCEYTITINAMGGTMSAPQEMSQIFGEYYALPTPTRTGYTCAGWYYGETRVANTGIWNRVGNIILHAKWTPIEYRITYDLGGVPAQNPNPAFYTVNDGTVVLKHLFYSNCMFLGWYSDTSFTNRVTEIPLGMTRPITLYAKWSIPTFTVTLDLNGGTGTKATYTYSALDLPISLSSLPAPSKDLHDFYYWAEGELDGLPVDEIQDCRDITLVANYLPEGTEIMSVSGGGFDGYRCQARYWPFAHGAQSQATIVFPKYHRLTNSRVGPYIDWIYIIDTSVKSISYADTVVAVNTPSGSSIARTVRH